jgi:hypothetical protein
MTVRANDIALGYLLEQGHESHSARHLRNEVPLRRWISMIELHDAWGEPPPAVGAWQLPQAIYERLLRANSGVPLLSVAADSEIRGRPTSPEADLDDAAHLCREGAGAMAVRADDIAFLDLGEKDIARLEHRLRPCESEGLHARIPMVEVHLVRLERLIAVVARKPPHVPKELDGR